MFRSFSPFRIQQNQKYFRHIAYVMRCMVDKQIYKMDRKSHSNYFISLGNITSDSASLIICHHAVLTS